MQPLNVVKILLDLNYFLALLMINFHLFFGFFIQKAINNGQAIVSSIKVDIFTFVNFHVLT